MLREVVSHLRAQAPREHPLVTPHNALPSPCGVSGANMELQRSYKFVRGFSVQFPHQKCPAKTTAEDLHKESVWGVQESSEGAADPVPPRSLPCQPEDHYDTGLQLHQRPDRALALSSGRCTGTALTMQ